MHHVLHGSAVYSIGRGLAALLIFLVGTPRPDDEMSREQTPTSFLCTAESASLAAKMIIFMKRLLLFLAVMVGFSSAASAQIGYNDVQIYIPAGYSIENAPYIDVWVSRDGMLYNPDLSIRKIEEMAKQDSGFLNSPQKVLNAARGFCYGAFPSRNDGFRKDYNLTTSTKTVYTRKESGGTNAWGQYTAPTVYHLAFSNDGKSLIKWEDGRSEHRSTYIRVDKNEFKPKADNLDFLYE